MFFARRRCSFLKRIKFRPPPPKKKNLTIAAIERINVTIYFPRRNFAIKTRTFGAIWRSVIRQCRRLRTKTTGRVRFRELVGKTKENVFRAGLSAFQGHLLSVVHRDLRRAGRQVENQNETLVQPRGETRPGHERQVISARRKPPTRRPLTFLNVSPTGFARDKCSSRRAPA